ncbi:MAG: DUF4340 domain-containing protein [Pseudomonadales bacterium]|nr:DUF4340 domain-containing protein [Pseudomonadales bacterium]
MNSRIQLLVVIALAQIVIVGLLLLTSGSTQEETGPWITLTQPDVTRIDVGDKANTASIAKGDSGWEIAGLPADEEKITSILQKLTELEAPWPVATSADALARFEVSEENHQRRVTVYAGEESVLELFLGTSPGYQRVHARKADDGGIYSVALSNYELPTDVGGWMDKALFAEREAPTEIVANLADGSKTYLSKGDEGWHMGGEVVDQDVATTYANRFKTFRVLGIYDGDKELELQGIIELGDPVTQSLEIFREVEEGDYALRVEGFSDAFEVSAYNAEQILMTDVEFSIEEASALEAEPTVE